MRHDTTNMTEDRRSRRLGLAVRVIPTVLALAALGGLVAAGQAMGWRWPALASLMGGAAADKEDWCDEHNVPDSICVECVKDCLPAQPAHGWCRKHGVHECPLEHPEIAQLPSPANVTAADLERSARALAFAPRPENNSKCTSHERRIQVASEAVLSRLAIGLAPVRRAPIVESISVPGEISYDPTRVAHLAPRTGGVVWRLEKQVGDRVRRGEVLALVDAAEVGRAKAEFQRALVQADLHRLTLANLQASVGTISDRALLAAESQVGEAEVRLFAAEQALAALEMPIATDEMRRLSPQDLARRIQFLGLPATFVEKLRGQTESSNLLAVTAPFDGEVVMRSATVGEAADPRKPLFVVADTSRLWLTLHVQPEYVESIRVGQSVQFRHDGHDGWDTGTISWMSPAADERTRTVPVRVDLLNSDGHHRAQTFGTVRVALRTEEDSIVVPSSAIHWEGDCYVAFVRDKNFERSKYKVFHVRTIRPGATSVGRDGQPVTEIIAGLLPGEYVAAAGSGVLRSQLLKSNMGAG